MKKSSILLFTIVFSLSVFSCQKVSTSEQGNEGKASRTIKALIIDGQNNHGIWPKTTVMMKDYLEQTGLFEVDVERTALTWQGPHNDNDDGFDEKQRLQLIAQFPIKGNKETTVLSKPEPDPGYRPDFSKYDVVISNFGWTAAPWPKETQLDLEKFVHNGGGLVIIHAASNSFPEWAEYNKMIGMGAWGDRSEKDGPYVYYDDKNDLIRDTSPGGAGSHGKQYAFTIRIRDESHPITQGMPLTWLHAQDELYDRLRGPAENMNVLATAYSDEEKNASPFSPLRGTGRHEPMMFTLNYGQGRVFHTPLGHTDYSMECVGFIVTLQRSAEWAATGQVSQTEIPNDFPIADKVSQRKWNP
jgi:type 1 glutamine amidotransferase